MLVELNDFHRRRRPRLTSLLMPSNPARRELNGESCATTPPNLTFSRICPSVRLLPKCGLAWLGVISCGTLQAQVLAPHLAHRAADCSGALPMEDMDPCIRSRQSRSL